MTIYTSQPDETTGIDAAIASANATTNYGTAITVEVGERAVVTSTARTLIKFDLSSIPSTAIINSAILSLWVKTDYSSNARDFKVYRVLRDWVEAQVTWNIWKTSNNWTTVGCGSDGNDADLTTVWATTNFTATEAAGTEKQFSLSTTEFKKFVDGRLTNYGWLIKADTETNDGYDFYSSSEATLTTRRPKLVVDYSMPRSTTMFF